jgi:hypothetical protein
VEGPLSPRIDVTDLDARTSTAGDIDTTSPMRGAFYEVEWKPLPPR